MFNPFLVYIDILILQLQLKKINKIKIKVFIITNFNPNFIHFQFNHSILLKFHPIVKKCYFFYVWIVVQY
jgi:hypothetical protein